MNSAYNSEMLHDCGDYLNNYCLRGRQVNDVVSCRCNKNWVLLEEKPWRYLVFWRVRESHLAETVWWHDRKAARRSRKAARA